MNIFGVDADRTAMLTRYQFEVLRALEAHGRLSQRKIASAVGVSIGSVNKAFSELRRAGLLDADGIVTDAGKQALDPYKVGNAIILAAGPAMRFAPLSYERPKAMFEVRGEVLIERLIRQLHEAGIRDVTIVVGYMKEAFFYLEDAFGVRIIVNPDFATRNNHASLYCAREQLGSTYICSADEYFAENVFSRYEYCSWYAAVPGQQPPIRLTVDADAKGRITRIGPCRERGSQARGPAYFDESASRQLMECLDADFDAPGIAAKLWDDVLADHIADFDIYLRELDPASVFEFNYMTDLVEFDKDFFSNVDSRILDNIAETLECGRDDIMNVQPMNAGLTNLSTLFSVGGDRYVYRHPGVGTGEIVNRAAEACALEIASELGLDDTFIYEDPDLGWKISRYIEDATELDYRNVDQVAQAMAMARMLHTSGKTMEWRFDFFDAAAEIAGMLKGRGFALPRDFDELEERVSSVDGLMKRDAVESVLCHNDFYAPNFLVSENAIRLIDWEYAAMGDPLCDLGNFVAQGSGYTVDEALGLLPLYFGRKATEAEERHLLAAVGVVGWYWYVWAMYKEAMGNPVGTWLYTWYKAAKQFSAEAERRYSELA